MVKDERIGSAVRGTALFIAVFSLLNVVARLRHAGFDANAWWIDFRPLPAGAATIAVASLAALLGLWSIRPRMGRWRTALTVSLLVLATAVAIHNTVTFYRLRAAHRIGGPLAVPFSLLVTLALLLFLRRVTRRRPTGGGGTHRVAFAAGVALCLLAFPLAQIAAFGMTDNRRPADAILVFGARAYADGRASDALEDRVLTAVELYEQGLAPRLIFSGGPGDGALSEAQVMRNLAVARGVPSSAIVLDDQGLTTDASVRNAARILGDPRGGRTLLAVSHAWHLPRVKLRCQREGLMAYTVPADERGQPLRKTPYLIAREVPALWVYYLRAIAS